MRKKSIIAYFALLCLGMSLLSGCDDPRDVARDLSVQETMWNDMGSSTIDAKVFSPLNKGDVVYDTKFAVITISSVNEERIVLDVDGAMVEPNDDGTINLRMEPIEKVTLKCAETIKLVSQTMDAGTTLVISFD